MSPVGLSPPAGENRGDAKSEHCHGGRFGNHKHDAPRLCHSPAASRNKVIDECSGRPIESLDPACIAVVDIEVAIVGTECKVDGSIQAIAAGECVYEGTGRPVVPNDAVSTIVCHVQIAVGTEAELLRGGEATATRGNEYVNERAR